MIDSTALREEMERRIAEQWLREFGVPRVFADALAELDTLTTENRAQAAEIETFQGLFRELQQQIATLNADNQVQAVEIDRQREAYDDLFKDRAEWVADCNAKAAEIERLTSINTLIRAEWDDSVAAAKRAMAAEIATLTAELVSTEQKAASWSIKASRLKAERDGLRAALLEFTGSEFARMYDALLSIYVAPETKAQHIYTIGKMVEAARLALSPPTLLDRAAADHQRARTAIAQAEAFLNPPTVKEG